MQFTKTKGFKKCAEYYRAKAYSSQADQGSEYNNCKEIIFIDIADCIIFPNKAEYKSNHTIHDEYNSEHHLKDFYFIFVELPKFTKLKEDQLENIIKKVMLFYFNF